MNIFIEIRKPSDLFGGNAEYNKTRNPEITTTALKKIALPE